METPRCASQGSARPYSPQHYAHCLFYAKGTCGECIDRCPAGALSEDGHDKVVCKAHLDRTGLYVTENYGFVGYGCGLCQVGIPCESQYTSRSQAP